MIDYDELASKFMCERVNAVECIIYFDQWYTQLHVNLEYGYVSIATDTTDPVPLPVTYDTEELETLIHTMFLKFPYPRKRLAEVEKKCILDAIERCDNDKPKSARYLGVSLKTLYNRLNSYDCCISGRIPRQATQTTEGSGS